jgi:hypothetical protein
VKIIAALLAAAGLAIALRWLAAGSDTQVHRINQK